MSSIGLYSLHYQPPVPEDWWLTVAPVAGSPSRAGARRNLFQHTLSEPRHPQNLPTLANGKSLPPCPPVPSSSPYVVHHKIPLSPSLPVAPTCCCCCCCNCCCCCRCCSCCTCLKWVPPRPRRVTGDRDVLACRSHPQPYGPGPPSGR